MVKLRRLRWAGNVARRGTEQLNTTFWSEISRRKEKPYAEMGGKY
jgi:hypothetical protein